MGRDGKKPHKSKKEKKAETQLAKIQQFNKTHGKPPGKRKQDTGDVVDKDESAPNLKKNNDQQGSEPVEVKGSNK
ncbi:uncharacterized protein L203_103013 [Cryptococcus depauperatus CBS 7841]|uniref:Uncharacterized protein n=1 Tax=Cryptococcus depauperatus CBS 7841 TaxID=1295531 RepID=A0AAJ8JSW4_9TREE